MPLGTRTRSDIKRDVDRFLAHRKWTLDWGFWSQYSTQTQGELLTELLWVNYNFWNQPNTDPKYYTNMVMRPTSFGPSNSKQGYIIETAMNTAVVEILNSWAAADQVRAADRGFGPPRQTIASKGGTNQNSEFESTTDDYLLLSVGKGAKLVLDSARVTIGVGIGYAVGGPLGAAASVVSSMVM